MDKTELLEVLNDWNFWRKELETGRPRLKHLEKSLKLLKTNVVLAIIGVRRSGKSFLMRQTIKRLIEKGEKRKNILMVNFEDSRFAELKPEVLEQVFETYLESLKPDSKPFVFLDEVHNVPKWEKWVRTMHELGKAKIVVSGSSSKLLSGELATVLTGRHLDIVVFPLSFKEFLQFENLEIKSELDKVAKKTELNQLFNKYLEFGGFPEVVLSSEKKQLLLTYFEDILIKDIEKRFKLRKREKLRALARFYLTNISGKISFNSVKKFLEITTNTAEKFSSYLEEANTVFFVKKFSFKTKEQEKAARKVYCVDVGLANAVGFKFSANLGKALENIVAIELKKKESTDPNTKTYYWGNPLHEEVDFAVKKGNSIEQLIQVCWNPNEYKTKERETKALIKASKELKCSKLLVITSNYKGEEKIKGKKIKFTPITDWLLQT